MLWQATLLKCFLAMLYSNRSPPCNVCCSLYWLGVFSKNRDTKIRYKGLSIVADEDISLITNIINKIIGWGLQSRKRYGLLSGLREQYHIHAWNGDHQQLVQAILNWIIIEFEKKGSAYAYQLFPRHFRTCVTCCIADYITISHPRKNNTDAWGLQNDTNERDDIRMIQNFRDISLFQKTLSRCKERTSSSYSSETRRAYLFGLRYCFLV